MQINMFRSNMGMRWSECKIVGRGRRALSKATRCKHVHHMNMWLPARSKAMNIKK